MPGIKEIAKATGYSLATISRVFNNSDAVSPKTKDKILKVAKELDYQPNRTAAALRSGKSMIIGVIVPEINNPFFSSIINGIEQKAEEQGYRIIIAQSHESEIKEETALQSLIKLNVDGILISISQETKGFSFLAKLKSNKIPIVFFDRTPSSLKNINQVVLNDFEGAIMATEHLIKQSCLNIVHISGNQQISIYRERQRGFYKAIDNNKGNVIKKNIIEFKMNKSYDSKILSDFIQKNNIDGIFAHGDECAIYTLDILKSLKIRVPKEIKLIGYGNLRYSTLTQPSISTISQSADRMGIDATQILLEKLKKGSTVKNIKKVLAPKLIERASTKI